MTSPPSLTPSSQSLPKTTEARSIAHSRPQQVTEAKPSAWNYISNPLLLRGATPSDVSAFFSPLAFAISLAAFLNTLRNNNRQKKLEEIRAVSDFIQQYNDLMGFVPKGFKIATLEDIPETMKPDAPRSSFYLIPYVVNTGLREEALSGDAPLAASTNANESNVAPTFCESDSFFLRYWMLQLAQYVVFKQGVLPREIYMVWMRSNAEVNRSGSHWITASAFKKGHEMCKGIFMGTNERRLRLFLSFTEDLFDGKRMAAHGFLGRLFMRLLEQDKILADEASDFQLDGATTP